MKVRNSHVAGRFYPGNKDEIDTLLQKLYDAERSNINTQLAQKQIIGGITPHAGYVYSGYEASHLFEIVKENITQYDTVFIINPNHSGYGATIALDNNEYWETPLGKVEVDTDFQDLLPYEKSAIAHQYEHSGEVVLPFLQYYFDYTFKIVPICILEQTYQNAFDLANDIFKSNKKLAKKILIIASTDFSHFVSPEEGRMQDELAVQEILKFNSLDLNKTVLRNNISMCGYGPVMTLLEYAKLVAEKPEIEILSRGHSGKTSPSSEVVDYISMLVYQ